MDWGNIWHKHLFFILILSGTYEIIVACIVMMVDEFNRAGCAVKNL